MGIVSLFTNAGKEGEADIAAPAFSLTKVQAGIGSLIAAVTGAVPAALASNQTVVVAAIASGTVVMLGIFALAAVDLAVRQRAAEAKLRYAGAAAPAVGTATAFVALPEHDDLVLQVGNNTDEFKVQMAEANEGEIAVFARHPDGRTMVQSFQRPAQG